MKPRTWPLTGGQPTCIAHRGASAHAAENTLRAFEVAAALGAEMWEIDIQLTADAVPVVCHDANLKRVTGLERAITDLTFSQLRDLAADIPSLEETIELAKRLGVALYVEIKARGAGSHVWSLLQARGFPQAVLGSFSVEEVRLLAEAECPYPLAVLVPLGTDPFERAEASRADIIHLCWERGGERPQDLVTPELLHRASQKGLGVVLWHEERRSVLNDIIKLPVLGICTNQPEMMRGTASLPRSGISIVCHRGANAFAPENTLAAARLSFEQGADYVEVDVRLSADGEIVVLHDPILDRTTNGTGPVNALTLAELKQLSAGAWFSDHYRAETIPTLGEMISLARSYGRRLYIENKSVDPALLMAFVEARGFFGECFFWSEDERLQEDMRRLAPHATIKANVGRYSSIEDMKAHLAPQLTEIDFADYERLAPACIEAGMVPMMQYFGSDPAVFDRIVALAPPMINLDRADMLLAAQRRHLHG